MDTLEYGGMSDGKMVGGRDDGDGEGIFNLELEEEEAIERLGRREGEYSWVNEPCFSLLTLLMVSGLPTRDDLASTTLCLLTAHEPVTVRLDF